MAALNFRTDQRLTTETRETLREFCSTLENDLIELANSLGLKVFTEPLMPYESGFLEERLINSFGFADIAA